jgi:hypothetical protein
MCDYIAKRVTIDYTKRGAEPRVVCLGVLPNGHFRDISPAQYHRLALSDTTSDATRAEAASVTWAKQRATIPFGRIVDATSAARRRGETLGSEQLCGLFGRTYYGHRCTAVPC